MDPRRAQSKIAVIFLLGAAVASGCWQETQVRSVSGPEYATTEVKLNGVKRGAMFRLCQQIPDDEDAANTFLWMFHEVLNAQEEHTEHLKKTNFSGEPWEHGSRKSVKTYVGELWTDGDRLRFAIIRSDSSQDGGMEMKRRLEDALQRKVN